MGFIGLLGLDGGAPPSNKLRSCVSYPLYTLDLLARIAEFCAQDFPPPNPTNHL